MRWSTRGKRNGIQWTMWQQLDGDLDFADDITLISSTQHQMQEKTSLMAFVVFHVSAPYKSTEFTFELKIFIFVPLEMFLALHTFPRMQEKTSLLGETSIKLGLRPNESKTKVMKINVKRNNLSR
jgi:hypothetical protein